MIAAMSRLPFLVSVLLAFALTATVISAAFFFGLVPGQEGTAGASPSPRASFAVPSLDVATPTPEPTEAPSPTPTEQPTPGGTYIVQPGDFLSGIGLKFGIPWQMIAEANGIEGPNYTIIPGQELIIPTLPTPSDGGDVYVVQAGDNIIAIANEYGIDPTDLADFNNLTDWNSIHPGDILYIPGPGWTPRPTETP